MVWFGHARTFISVGGRASAFLSPCFLCLEIMDIRESNIHWEFLNLFRIFGLFL